MKPALNIYAVLCALAALVVVSYTTTNLVSCATVEEDLSVECGFSAAFTGIPAGFRIGVISRLDGP